MTVAMYGIANCDTIKRAKSWLAEHGVEYTFHDFKKEGVDDRDLVLWTERHGWETVLNTRGTTFRKLPDADKHGIDRAKAIALMKANTSLIKRPVLALDDHSLVGFDEAAYSREFD